MDAQPTDLVPRPFRFIEVHDPRADNARHFLTDILGIALLGVMCGCDDYPGIVDDAVDQQDWLKTFLHLPHGIAFDHRRADRQTGGDYLMAVKDNHPTPHDSIVRHLDELILEKLAGIDPVSHETTDGGHGRIDTRRLWATERIDWLASKEPWKQVRSVAVVESTRRVLGKGESKTTRRYYISSLPADSGERMAELIRNHGSIENSRHWTLDMAFNEDPRRVRKDHGDQNPAVLRRMAPGLRRRDKQTKVGAKNKRLKACRNRDYLLNVLLSPVSPE